MKGKEVMEDDKLDADCWNHPGADHDRYGNTDVVAECPGAGCEQDTVVVTGYFSKPGGGVSAGCLATAMVRAFGNSFYLPQMNMDEIDFICG
jgi:hypothetical protein